MRSLKAVDLYLPGVKRHFSPGSNSMHAAEKSYTSLGNQYTVNLVVHTVGKALLSCC